MLFTLFDFDYLNFQIAPIYLISCVKHGVGLLEILLYKQPVYHSQVLLKNIEICRMYDLDSVSSNAMKVNLFVTSHCLIILENLYLYY